MNTLLRCCMVWCVLVPAGCGAMNQPGPTTRAAATRPAPEPVDPATPILAGDPCANRLHDLCGALLLYYAIHHRLPDKLDELQSVPGFEHVRDLTCPTSKQPYVYSPVGMLDLQKHTRVLIYDAAPSHAGRRWAISVIEPQGNEALVTKVVGMPESWFVLHPPSK